MAEPRINSANLFSSSQSQESSFVQNAFNQQSQHQHMHHSSFERHDSAVIESLSPELEGNESFFKFLSAVITTLIVIFFSHLWYIDKNEEFDREEEALTEAFYQSTRGVEKITKACRKFEKNPRRANRSRKQKLSNRHRSPGRFRHLSWSESSLESIAESEDEKLAEQELLLDEFLTNQKLRSASANQIGEHNLKSELYAEEKISASSTHLRVKNNTSSENISEQFSEENNNFNSNCDHFSLTPSASVEETLKSELTQSGYPEPSEKPMERKLRHSYDNLTDYNSDKNGPQFNGLPPDSGRGSANTDLNLSSLQNNSFNLSTVSANFQPNSYNDFINSLNNTSVCSTNEPKHNNLSERTPVSSRRKVITSGTPRKVNGLKSTLPNRPFHPKDGFKITQNGHILNATMESVASTDLVSMNDSTLTHGRKKVIPKVLITNELTEEDRRRTSLAEAYPYVKSESSNNVVIAITKDEETRERKAISKALNDLQSLHEDFEVQSQSINGNVRSARSLNCSVDRLMPSASQDGLSASFIASSVSSNEKIFFDGLTKNELRTHKDISFRRKNYESMSSDDNYSVSTREMMDEVSDVVVMIRCRFKACGKIKELKEAKKYYKMCHNCFTYYCSRNCREAHWQRHKIKCVYSRVNSACKTVLNVLRNSRRNVETLSQFAEQQFYPEGRGVVFVKFSNLSDAEIFTP